MSYRASNMIEYDGSRASALTRVMMDGDVVNDKPKPLTNKEKFDKWMINEGYRRL